MLKPAPPIRVPSTEVRVRLIQEIEQLSAESKDSGPLFAFDAKRLVFLSLVLHRGRLVAWQVEPCHSTDEADELRRRYAAQYVQPATGAAVPATLDGGLLASVRAPGRQMLGELLKLVDAGRVESGPIFAFDAERKVFVTLVVDQGLVVHWVIEPCQDSDGARALLTCYRGMVAEAAVLLMQAAESSAGCSPSAPSTPGALH